MISSSFFMKKPPVVLAVAMFVCVLASCNTVTVKHRYTLSAEYAAANLSNRKFVVLFPPDERIVINNKNDAVNAFGGANVKPESRIRKYYLPLFFGELKSLVSGDSFFLADQYRPGLFPDSIAMKEITLQTGDSGAPTRYALPEKASLQARGLDSAIFIIVERLEFKRNNFHIDYYWDDKSRQSANLEADAVVMIWDYMNDRPVFYGPLSNKVEFTFSMQRKHWEESARLLARKIVRTVKCL